MDLLQMQVLQQEMDQHKSFVLRANETLEIRDADKRIMRLEEDLAAEQLFRAAHIAEFIRRAVAAYGLRPQLDIIADMDAQMAALLPFTEKQVAAGNTTVKKGKTVAVEGGTIALKKTSKVVVDEATQYDVIAHFAEADRWEFLAVRKADNIDALRKYGTIHGLPRGIRVEETFKIDVKLDRPEA